MKLWLFLSLLRVTCYAYNVLPCGSFSSLFNCFKAKIFHINDWVLEGSLLWHVMPCLLLLLQLKHSLVDIKDA